MHPPPFEFGDAINHRTQFGGGGQESILAPGNSIGAFATGSLTLAGTFLAEIDVHNGGAASADLLNITGNFSITGPTLMLMVDNVPALGTFPGGTYLLAANDGSDAISGSFGSITGVPAGLHGFNRLRI